MRWIKYQLNADTTCTDVRKYIVALFKKNETLTFWQELKLFWRHKNYKMPIGKFLLCDKVRELKFFEWINEEKPKLFKYNIHHFVFWGIDRGIDRRLAWSIRGIRYFIFAFQHSETTCFWDFGFNYTSIQIRLFRQTPINIGNLNIKSETNPPKSLLKSTYK